jgi:putative dimethyl sulfoxide reductase chaperone
MQPICTDLKRKLCLDALKTLCRIFWGPDLALCQDIKNGSLVMLLQDVSDVFKTDLSFDVKAVETLIDKNEDDKSLCEVLSDGYIALFVNDMKGIPAPLYHSCYLASDTRLMGFPALDMKKRLDRHGLSISLPGNEPADHLAIELEYLYYLLITGWSKSSGNYIQEAIQFARDSMDGWVRLFYERILADDRFPFYMIAARLLCLIIRSLGESQCFVMQAKT